MADESLEVPGTPPASGDAALAVPPGDTPPPTAIPADAVSDQAAAPEPKKVDPRQKKIAELSYQLRESQRQIDRLVGVVEKATTQRSQAEQPPKISDFHTVEEFLDARDTWRDKQRQATSEPRRQEPQADQAFESARDDLIITGSEKYQDFEEVVRDEGVRITPVMAQAMFSIDDQELQAEVAYYLGKNPKEALRISRLNPMRQVTEIGKLEAKISSQPAPVKRPSAAPAPIVPVGGNASADIGPSDKDDVATWIKKRNKQLGRG